MENKPQEQEIEIKKTQEKVKKTRASKKVNVNNIKPQTVDPVYLAIDSDFLRDLSYYMIAKSTEEDKIKTSVRIADNIDSLRYFKDLIENNCIKLVITSTVFHECAKVPFCTDFIKKHCIIPKIDFKNYRKYAVETAKLANAYCFEEIEINGEKVNAMHPQYSAVLGEEVPTNDAFIMAEASLLGLCLITLNQRDFIQRPSIHSKAKKGQIEEYNDIVQGITTINKKYGYIYESTKNYNFYTCSRPFSPANFMEINKGSQNLSKFICPKPLIKEDGEILEKSV